MGAFCSYCGNTFRRKKVDNLFSRRFSYEHTEEENLQKTFFFWLVKPNEVEFVTLANVQPHIRLQSVTTIQIRRGCYDVICCICLKCCVVMKCARYIVTLADSTENIQGTF